MERPELTSPAHEDDDLTLDPDTLDPTQQQPLTQPRGWALEPSPPDSTSEEATSRFEVAAAHVAFAHYCRTSAQRVLRRWRAYHAFATTIEAKVTALSFWRRAGLAWRLMLEHAGRSMHRSMRLRVRQAMRRLRRA
eukprot:3459592-Prymnesium_polylepis.1